VVCIRSFNALYCLLFTEAVTGDKITSTKSVDDKQEQISKDLKSKAGLILV